MSAKTATLDTAEETGAELLSVSAHSAAHFIHSSTTTKLLEIQIKYKLKHLRTNGGGEFKDKFWPWLPRKGALCQCKSRESPEQNASEGLNSPIWDCVQPVTLASGPFSYWSCVMQVSGWDSDCVPILTL